MLKFFDPSREDEQKVTSLANQVTAARNAFMTAQDALAFVVLALAEADCKGASAAYEKLQQVRLAHQHITRHLEELLIDLRGRRAPPIYELGDPGPGPAPIPAGDTGVGAGKAAAEPVRNPLPTPRQIAESAAHLVATLDAMPVELDNLPGPVKEVVQNLRRECETAGLMAPYVFPGSPGFKVPRRSSGGDGSGTG